MGLELGNYCGVSTEVPNYRLKYLIGIVPYLKERQLCLQVNFELAAYFEKGFWLANTHLHLYPVSQSLTITAKMLLQNKF